jgi:hypothetical protein
MAATAMKNDSLSMQSLAESGLEKSQAFSIGLQTVSTMPSAWNNDLKGFLD